jgi:hypothetical protein
MAGLWKLAESAKEWEVGRIFGRVCFDTMKAHAQIQINVEDEGRQAQR